MAEKITDGGMENWSGEPLQLDSWIETVAGSSAIVQESTIKDSGSYSCKFAVDSGDACRIRQNITLTAGAPYTLTVRAYGDATNTIYVRLLDNADNVWLQSDGTWSAVQANLYESEPAASWNTIVNLNFNAHASYTNYEFYVSELEEAATWNFYIDNVSLVDNESAGVDPCLFFGCNF